MMMNSRSFLAVALLVALAPATVRPEEARPQDKPDAKPPPAGPRHPVGPDVPLTEDEKSRLEKRVTVAGPTAAAVQAACERAAKEGLRVVVLPAGQYVFDSEVLVPAGLTVLGEGAGTVCKAGSKTAHLFRAGGDGVRFTRLRLEGAGATTSTDNDTYGITVERKQDVRIDHCELTGFSYATNFADEATAQLDRCSVHHNLRDGLGYGVALYSGAYVLIADNEFAQNRHSLASNGALDWSSPKTLGKYVHKPGVRKTHWEFVHNRVDSNDLSAYELCAVDTHPGMDGTFVIERNLFENLRHGVGIRDGSGLIAANVFRSFRGKSFRPFVAISVAYDTHNNIPVEGCMPHDIKVENNTFSTEGPPYRKCEVGKAENITLDGELLPATKAERPPPPPMPLLSPMDAEGKLRIGTRPR
ncbi:MAG: right-handed parallel beta-helix repeat-containing protein [Planctomycetota bacterium]|nr:right-handed parallel beta-helix repeat-containing protein [Planctomycetota bacterium]